MSLKGEYMENQIMSFKEFCERYEELHQTALEASKQHFKSDKAQSLTDSLKEAYNDYKEKYEAK